MIARILLILTVLYVVLVCIGVAIVTALQPQLGFFGALVLAIGGFLAVAGIAAVLILRRIRSLRSWAMANAGGMMERLRTRRP